MAAKKVGNIGKPLVSKSPPVTPMRGVRPGGPENAREAMDAIRAKIQDGKVFGPYSDDRDRTASSKRVSGGHPVR